MVVVVSLEVQAAVARAHRYAFASGADSMEPSHLLAGLAALRRGNAFEILRSLSVDLDGLHRNIYSGHFPNRPQDAPRSPLNQTDAARKVMRLAVVEMKAAHAQILCSEHLLLGLLQEEDNQSSVLKDFGVNVDLVRKALADAHLPTEKPGQREPRS